MTKLEVSIDINPSKEVKGKSKCKASVCKASVITFGAHLNEDKDKLDVQTEEKIILSIKKVVVSLLEDVASGIEDSKETK